MSPPQYSAMVNVMIAMELPKVIHSKPHRPTATIVRTIGGTVAVVAVPGRIQTFPKQLLFTICILLLIFIAVCR